MGEQTKLLYGVRSKCCLIIALFRGAPSLVLGQPTTRTLHDRNLAKQMESSPFLQYIRLSVSGVRLSLPLLTNSTLFKLSTV